MQVIRRLKQSIYGSWRIVLLPLALAASPAAADIESKTDGEWWVAGFGGVMTDGRAHEALDPFNVDFVDYYVAGLVLGWEKRIGISRFSYGAEVQANAHFGDQSFYELVIPAIIRYHPERSWFDAFDSFAFALGPSIYSEISDLERDNYGESRESLVYWYLETEFKTADPDSSFFARIHHRSNAWDLVEPNGGSNALVLGYRRKF